MFYVVSCIRLPSEHTEIELDCLATSVHTRCDRCDHRVNLDKGMPITYMHLGPTRSMDAAPTEGTEGACATE